jgi:tetratricopeptide (TPR) repeat protein
MMGVTLAWAQDYSETRRLLEVNDERQAAERERQRLKDQPFPSASAAPRLLHAQSFLMLHKTSVLSEAIYRAIHNQQWAQVQKFMIEYLLRKDRDPLLVDYAHANLARAQGRLGDAQAAFRRLLAHQPDFMPAQLELARVLFEDEQGREAKQAFSKALASIDAQDPKTAGVRTTIQNYCAELAKQQAWTGIFSFGPTWSDNVNRTSADSIYVYEEVEGERRRLGRKVASKVVAPGVELGATLQRDLPLYGHHGAYLRTALDATRYHDAADYNETTVGVRAGYRYRSLHHHIALAPTFEYSVLGNNAVYGSYGAWGVQGEWNYTRSPRSLLKLEGEYKTKFYRQPFYANRLDGAVGVVGASYFQEMGGGWMLFGGVSFVDYGAKEKFNAYLQKGVRLGASRQWSSGFVGTLIVAYNHRDFAASDPRVETRYKRKDNEQRYVIVLKAPRWQVAGFVPGLTLRHNRVKSNVGWLYSYNRNDISLGVDYTF